MSKQKNILLLAVLIIQLAIVAFMYRPGQSPSQAVIDLFSDLKPDQVTEMTITDDEGKSVILTKTEGWSVGQDKFPADSEKIAQIITKISELKSSRLVTKTTASHTRLKVAESLFNRKVTLKGIDKDISFYLGTAPGSKSIHLRLADSNDVFLVKDLAGWELQTEKESWWQSKYINLQPTKLSEISLANEEGTVVLVRDSDGGWKLGGTAASASGDKNKIIKLVSSLTAISISEYMPATYSGATEKEVATVNYTGKDIDLTLQIWKKDKDDDEHLVKNNTSNFFAKMKAYILADILKAKVEGLLAAEKEPVAAETVRPE